MKTIIYNKEDLDLVANELLKGKVIAFPTDTVYGVGVIYNDLDALNRLKQAKDRPETKPIPTMVGSIDDLETVAYVNDDVLKVAKAFMPGPITLILPKKENVCDFVTNGKNSIAVRIPNNEFLLSLIKKSGKALLVSSANISGKDNCFNTDDVIRQLDGRIAGIVEGESGGSMASTIVDMTGDEPLIIREGPITYNQINEVLKKVR